ncbi:MAG: TonB-dependent receptor plug domain-containing protein [Acidobacteriaceae bacterium]|jgi:iron complex outermembrane receptor protein/vitamin B12 transporter
MSAVSGRQVAASLLRASALRRCSTLAAFLLLPSLLLVSVPPARAVVVRGVVTDPLGLPVSGARIQLIQGQKAVAIGIAGADGAYEIRSTLAGRFVLLTSAATFAPGIGKDFYGGSTDDITQNIVLEIAAVHAEITVTATGVPTPVQQSSSAVTLIPDLDLATTIGISDALRQSPGVDIVQQGQMGGLTSLFVRGGNSDANKVLIDGIPAEDVGGRFDFGTVSSSGVTGLEIYRGPDSVLYGSDAASSTIAFSTPRGSDLKPVVNYTGSAGNFHTYQNEGTVSGAYKRADYLGGFSRVDTSNALPMDEYHSGTAVANLGYDLTATTPLRFTLRNAVSASGEPDAHDFYGISAAAKQADQDLYSGLTIQNTLEGNWHNLARYGIARKREQFTTFYPVGQLVIDQYGDQTYYGNKVTIRGANGYAATGQAAIAYGCGTPNPASCYPQEDFADSNRDELYYQTDYTFPKRIVGLFGFRYENERGSFVYPVYGEAEAIQRTNFEYILQFSGDILNRIFYSAGGAVEKNHLYGVAGTPRIGLAYVPVRPGGKVFRGTKIRVNVATGVQEPSLATDFSSLYTQLQALGDTAAIKTYRITPIRELRTRTLDAGIDQNIYRAKLIFKAGYFHNAFSHQIEYVDSGTLKQDFGINLCPSTNPNCGGVPNFYGADVGSLAFHAQGAESELEYRPFSRLFLHAGYTYLNAKVDQSFASSALSVTPGGFPETNPAFPNIPIGESPFIGARPFRRPPNTGYFAAQYSGTNLTAAFKGAFASRSDDSTFLDYSDLAGTNSLILPNRSLDFGYAKLDANFMYAIKRRVTVFTELDNLLGQQHIGPIGYPSLPFTVRAGLKLRIGGE